MKPRNEVGKDYYQRHKEKIKAKAAIKRDSQEYKNMIRRLTLRKRYGITPEDYEVMLEKQNGACAICHTTEPNTGKKFFDVDHNHETEKVRGLLCGRCNKYVGLLENNESLRQKAEAYIESYEDVEYDEKCQPTEFPS